jgi:CTP-dependent riboflavin kinase
MQITAERCEHLIKNLSPKSRVKRYVFETGDTRWHVACEDIRVSKATFYRALDEMKKDGILDTFGTLRGKWIETRVLVARFTLLPLNVDTQKLAEEYMTTKQSVESQLAYLEKVQVIRRIHSPYGLCYVIGDKFNG